MADKVKKESKVVEKYKASDPKRFKESYNEAVPFYDELSKGKSVVVDTNDKQIKSWLNNKILIKE
tara:strand:+ start:939 stop:1133 length:195 start_codon:yes stop_codon:yes gene_type:complete